MGEAQGDGAVRVSREGRERKREVRLLAEGIRAPVRCKAHRRSGEEERRRYERRASHEEEARPGHEGCLDGA